jgi:DNA-binding FadR family transcriptional regulator
MNDTGLMRLRGWIGNSGLSKGAQLPPERELCTALGISRAELRKALLVLEADEVLERHVGRGTFLCRTARPARGGGGVDRTIAGLSETTGPTEAMNARLAIEPKLAQLAALHATPLQLRDMRRLIQAMRDASSWAGYEALDSDFHEAIAAASGNGLLQALHKILNGVRLAVVWRRLDTQSAAPGSSYHSFAEHYAILTALENRDHVGAALAMQTHLESTLSMMTTSPVD